MDRYDPFEYQLDFPFLPLSGLFAYLHISGGNFVSVESLESEPTHLQKFPVLMSKLMKSLN